MRTPSLADRLSRQRLGWGAASLLASLQYLIVEAVAAAAWQGSGYSYVRDYISDLGVAACAGPAGGLCSPLAWLMNASFVLQGLLFIASTLLLAPAVPHAGWRRIVVVLGLTHGFGTILVGLAPAVRDAVTIGGVRVHIIGAYLAIAGGNFAITAAGWAARALGARPWFVIASLGLGAVGMAGAVLLVTWRVPIAGLLERIGADAVTVWTLMAGGLLSWAMTRPAPRS